MFRVGDKVVHPHHGAGLIEDIQEKEFLEERRKYYIFRLSLGDLKIMVPAETVDAVGLRCVITPKKAEQALEVLYEEQSEMHEDWNKRFKENNEKLCSGDVVKVAEVIRDLTLRDLRTGLSTREKRMLGKARQILISELMHVFGTTEETATERIDEILF